MEKEQYAYSASIPLKILYIMLTDMYKQNYPIKFIDFRETFNKYMKLTNNTLIDSVILMIYGADDISKIGTGEEEIAIDGHIEKSPFWRFFQGDKEIRIGYDYACVLDFNDSTDNNNINEIKSDDNTDLVETDKDVYHIENFSISINLDKNILLWNYHEKYYQIDLINQKFIVETTSKLYDITLGEEIETQPVPKGCVAKNSIQIGDKIVTVLEDGNHFVYNPSHSSFDTIYHDKIINGKYRCIRNYVFM